MVADNAGTGKLNGIEAGRGVAASAVVLYHAARHLNFNYGMKPLMSAFQFGHAGVDFFFVISGFIILYVHYRDIGTPARLGHYIVRRFTRVMPTYWVALALTVAMSVAAGHGLPSVDDVAWSASLLPANHDLLLGIAWTLRYEIAFYAIFCVLILNRATGLLVLSVWFGATIAALATGGRVAGVPDSLYGVFNMEFFFGMAVAYIVRTRRVPAPKALLILGIALFLLVAAAEDVGILDGYADAARFYYGIPAALIVLGIAELGRRGEMVVSPLFRMLGLASYSIYLFQFVFIGSVWQLWLTLGLDQRTPYASSYPFLAAAAIAGGILMSRWVENPLIRLARGQGLNVKPRAAIG